MKGLTVEMQKVMELLKNNQGRWMKAREIAEAVGYHGYSSDKKVQNIVRGIRKKFDKGQITEWIYSEPRGYILILNQGNTGKASHNEASMRIKMSLSTFLNGEHCINEAKSSGGRQFQKLLGFVRPKFISMGKMIKELSQTKEK